MRESIPDEWEEAHQTFLEYARAERTARLRYRRAVDSAYAPVSETLALLNAVAPLAALRDELAALEGEIGGLEGEAAGERVDALQRPARGIPGGNEIALLLGDAERAFTGRNPDPEEGRELVAQAMATAEAELAWRREAAETVRPGLIIYNQAIRGTIGLRGQPRLPREQALEVARCSAKHRDISLSF